MKLRLDFRLLWVAAYATSGLAFLVLLVLMLALGRQAIDFPTLRTAAACFFGAALTPIVLALLVGRAVWAECLTISLLSACGGVILFVEIAEPAGLLACAALVAGALLGAFLSHRRASLANQAHTADALTVFLATVSIMGAYLLHCLLGILLVWLGHLLGDIAMVFAVLAVIIFVAISPALVAYSLQVILPFEAEAGILRSLFLPVIPLVFVLGSEQGVGAAVGWFFGYIVGALLLALLALPGLRAATNSAYWKRHEREQQGLTGMRVMRLDEPGQEGQP